MGSLFFCRRVCHVFDVVLAAAAALNAVLVKLGLMVPLPWIHRDPCADPPTNDTSDYGEANLFFSCDCSYQNSTVCHVTRL